jgi:hypothetical protein
MSRGRNELEWLGFEMALGRYFIDRGGPAAILTDLVRHPATVRTFEHLAIVCRLTEESVPVMTSRLREQLRDLGFAVRVENIRGVGYRITRSGAQEIWDRVMASVLHMEQDHMERAA